MANNASENTSEKVEGFITRNRVIILAIVGILLVVGIAVGVGYGVSDKVRQTGLAALEQIETTYSTKTDDLTDDELAARKEQALEALSAYTGKRGVVGARANMLAGSVAYAQNDFNSAANYYVAAAEAEKKAYTAPVCYFNAASCYEELDNLEYAEKYYALSAVDTFSLQAHALFSLGRVREATGNISGAVEAYEKVASAYDSVSWADLANSRIIVLKSQGKTE